MGINKEEVRKKSQKNKNSSEIFEFLKEIFVVFVTKY